jgi:hypothetical protein
MDTFIHQILQLEHLPLAITSALFGSFALWNLLQKEKPLPTELTEVPPYTKELFDRDPLYGFSSDRDREFAEAQSNWPRKWRKNTQWARDAWQARERKRVKDARTIGWIFLGSVLWLSVTSIFI